MCNKFCISYTQTNLNGFSVVQLFCAVPGNKKYFFLKKQRKNEKNKNTSVFDAYRA